MDGRWERIRELSVAKSMGDGCLCVCMSVQCSLNSAQLSVGAENNFFFCEWSAQKSIGWKGINMILGEKKSCSVCYRSALLHSTHFVVWLPVAYILAHVLLNCYDEWGASGCEWNSSMFAFRYYFRSISRICLLALHTGICMQIISARKKVALQWRESCTSIRSFLQLKRFRIGSPLMAFSLIEINNLHFT